MRKKVSADMSALGIVLERHWDPAGVYHDLSDDPWPSGEYDTYGDGSLGTCLMVATRVRSWPTCCGHASKSVSPASTRVTTMRQTRSLSGGGAA